jgi:hypothetical protein
MKLVLIKSIKFWINAFIPRDVPGYTTIVPAGSHAGMTMIPGPQTVAVPIPPRASPWMFFQPVGHIRVGVSDCYLTDQRDFSDDIHAKSRMHSEFRIDFTARVPTMTQWHNCDFTTECDCEDGEVECHQQGKTDRMQFRLLQTNPTLKISLKGAGNNPCAPTSRLFGDIDYEGTILFDPVSRTIEIDTLIDEFPAFEAYATINDGAGTALFREPPPTGNTVMNLPAAADRRIRRKLRDSDGDGIFETLTTPT